MAVLTDPKLTIMIRDLGDTSRKESKTSDVEDGQAVSDASNGSLDPKVTITDSTGKQVAEGPMPFG
jgi:hypothetical protein